MSESAPIRFRASENTALYGCAGLVFGGLYVVRPEPLHALPLALWAAAGLLQLAWGFLALRHAALRFEAPPHAFRAGQRLALRVGLRNRSAWFRPGPLRLVPRLSDRATDLPAVLVRHTPAPLAERELDLDLGTAARGRPLASVERVESLAPFALFRAERRLDLRAHLVVWPARLPDLPAPAATLGRRGVRPPSGPELARRSASGGVRDLPRGYRPGDPPRAIHWKLSARTGSLIVSRFRGPPVSTYWLHLDVFGPDWGERVVFERALRLLATLAEAGFRSGQLRGVTIGRQSRVLGDSATLAGLLDHLAGLPAPASAAARGKRGAPPTTAATVTPSPAVATGGSHTRRDVLRILPGPGGKVLVLDRRDEIVLSA